MHGTCLFGYFIKGHHSNRLSIFLIRFNLLPSTYSYRLQYSKYFLDSMIRFNSFNLASTHTTHATLALLRPSIVSTWSRRGNRIRPTDLTDWLDSLTHSLGSKESFIQYCQSNTHACVYIRFHYSNAYVYMCTHSILLFKRLYIRRNLNN